MSNDPRVKAYWQKFLATLPADSPLRQRPYVADGFGDNPALADELAQLIVSGAKTATCSSVWDYELRGEPVPVPGLLTILLDGRGQPLCILETTEVNLRRYDEVDAQLAHDEGEGDLSLAFWRDAHWRYFTRILAQHGKQPALDMPLVCERFRVIYQ
jgi:uncharacterized protein YhfF